MDIETHKPSGSPSQTPPDPIGAEFRDPNACDSASPSMSPGLRRTTFVMPSAEAIADAIIRRAAADLRG